MFQTHLTFIKKLVTYMLEIIAIFTLGKAIKKIVQAKGFSATKYILLMVFFWISFEFLGLFLGMVVFGDRLVPIYLLALLGAVLGGYLSYHIAKTA